MINGLDANAQARVPVPHRSTCRLSSHSAHELADGHAEAGGEGFERAQAGFAAAVFDSGDVVAADAALGGQLGLAPAAGAAQPAEALAETNADVRSRGHRSRMGQGRCSPCGLSTTKVFLEIPYVEFPLESIRYSLLPETEIRNFFDAGVVVSGYSLQLPGRLAMRAHLIDSICRRNQRRGECYEKNRSHCNFAPGLSGRRAYLVPGRFVRRNTQTGELLHTSSLPARLSSTTTTTVKPLTARALASNERSQGPC